MTKLHDKTPRYVSIDKVLEDSTYHRRLTIDLASKKCSLTREQLEQAYDALHPVEDFLQYLSTLNVRTSNVPGHRPKFSLNDLKHMRIHDVAVKPHMWPVDAKVLRDAIVTIVTPQHFHYLCHDDNSIYWFSEEIF